MNVMNQNPLKRWAAPAAGLFSILAVTTSHAALVAPNTTEAAGAVLGGGTSFGANASLAGTVVGNKTTSFLEPSALFQGTLRSVVVQNTAGLLDFYFQLSNTSNLAPVSTGPGLGSDIFRLTLSGFAGFGTGAGDGLEMNYRTDGLAGIAGAGAFVIGTKPAFSADRDPALATQGGVGFDFDASQFLGGPGNVDSGQTSEFLLIRTNARAFRNVSSEVVSGFGTAFTSGFAPAAVPEPATALAGLLLGSLVAFRDMGRGRRRQPVPAKA